jgi:hypothetical protein
MINVMNGIAAFNIQGRSIRRSLLRLSVRNKFVPFIITPMVVIALHEEFKGRHFVILDQWTRNAKLSTTLTDVFVGFFPDKQNEWFGGLNVTEDHATAGR